MPIRHSKCKEDNDKQENDEKDRNDFPVSFHFIMAAGAKGFYQIKKNI